MDNQKRVCVYVPRANQITHMVTYDTSFFLFQAPSLRFAAAYSSVREREIYWSAHIKVILSLDQQKYLLCSLFRLKEESDVKVFNQTCPVAALKRNKCNVGITIHLVWKNDGRFNEIYPLPIQNEEIVVNTKRWNHCSERVVIFSVSYSFNFLKVEYVLCLFDNLF